MVSNILCLQTFFLQANCSNEIHALKIQGHIHLFDCYCLPVNFAFFLQFSRKLIIISREILTASKCIILFRFEKKYIIHYIKYQYSIHNSCYAPFRTCNTFLYIMMFILI